jgi:hypothetical protein
MRFARLGWTRFALAACAVATLAGCEDDPPPPPQGGFTATFVSTGADCSLDSHTGHIGNVSSTEKELKQHGTDSTEIECTISASSISADAYRKSDYLAVEVGSISPNATQDDPATGIISFVSANTVDVFTSPADSPCEVWFDEGTDQGIQAGEAWFAFRCAVVEAQGGRTCAIQQGYAAFANCQ